MYSNIEKYELLLRWERTKKIMAENGVESLIVSDNTSILYLAGRIFAGVIYISLDGGDPLFFVRRPVGVEGENVVYIRKVEDIPSILIERGYGLPQNVALEGDVATYNEYLRLQKLFGLAPDKVLSSATTILRRARSVKTAYEIEQIRYSAGQHSKLYSKVKSLFREGMSDNDLAIEMEREARKLGSVGSMRIFGRSMEVFVGSILVGDNADSASPYDFALGGAGIDPSLPVSFNGTKIVEGTTVMVDQGGNFCSYMTDMTRVFSYGKIPAEVVHAHNMALEMQSEMMSRVKVGTPTADVYNLCIDIAKRESIEQYFMGHTQQAGFVGHGVGIEVNEAPVLAPRSREIFEEGTVFALEPKFVFPKIGAVGVENTFLVTKDGVEKLTIFEENIIELG